MKHNSESCQCCGQKVGKRPLTPTQLGYTQPKIVAMNIDGGTFDIDGLRSWTRTKPATRPGTNAHVSTPLLQALWSGVFLAISSIFPAVFYAWPWYTPLAVWSVSATAVWFGAVAFYKTLMQETETIEIDSPPTPPETVIHKIEITDHINKTRHYPPEEVPIPIEKMRAAATAILLPGGTLSRGYLCDSRGILTQQECTSLRRWMIETSLAEPRPNKSNFIRPVGMAVLRQFRDEK